MVKGMSSGRGWTWGRTVTTLSASLATIHGVNAVDTAWHSPNATQINNLDKVLDGKGVYGFIFNSSHTPDKEYGQYNWCNMPHVRRSEYIKAPDEYELQYIEVIHRHHKRSPYDSNLFPNETGSWDCRSEGLPHDSQSLSELQRPLVCLSEKSALLILLELEERDDSCSFPQITTEGLIDSWQHGRDIYGVYYELLHFIPKHLDSKKVTFRVTTNEITSQVARPLIDGMYDPKESVPLLIQKTNDSLEPDYPCNAADDMYDDARSQKNTTWTAHLKRSQPLFDELDAVSRIPKDSEDWHSSFDHYFDNLSARLCHHMALPCKSSDYSLCINEEQANEVFRLGQFEYSYTYRDSPTSLAASSASFGVWVEEVAQHLRDQIAGKDGEMVYRHNVAHDGSVSRLLSVLQIDVMIWPGMGSEVVFELYRHKKKVYHGNNYHSKDYAIRVLFGGQVMRSSNPDLGLLDFKPVDSLLDYFDGLVGKNASLVPELCEG